MQIKLLTLLFNNILTDHSMPPTMCQATISLLPKPGKDHSEMNNFRPISMLNNVYKLFAKILAIYLGINIKTPIEDIFDLNGPLLLKTIREDIKRWTVLPILWGRAEVLKMNNLWSNRKTRISYKRLSRSRKRGGLGVPDFCSYYLAYNAGFPFWKWVEETILANQDKSFSLTALWYYPITNLKIVNPLIKFSCEKTFTMSLQAANTPH
uniref:Uncharacterized protein n=1 Tax=Gadus morhua TaxID=8049 RepID=A0A8C5APU3_GADMO